MKGCHGNSVKLTLKEFQILVRLAISFPQGPLPTELRFDIWGSFQVVSKALDVHIFTLRRKLRGLGYNIILDEENRYVLTKV